MKLKRYISVRYSEKREAIVFSYFKGSRKKEVSIPCDWLEGHRVIRMAIEDYLKTANPEISFSGLTFNTAPTWCKEYDDYLAHGGTDRFNLWRLNSAKIF